MEYGMLYGAMMRPKKKKGPIEDIEIQTQLGQTTLKKKKREVQSCIEDGEINYETAEDQLENYGRLF